MNRCSKPFQKQPATLTLVALALAWAGTEQASQAQTATAATAVSDKIMTVPRTPTSAPETKTIRVASFNAAMNRKSFGQLTEELKNDNEQISKIAAIIQAVGPDILLLNEIDRDEQAAELFLKNHLSRDDPAWKYFFAGPVNTGVDSGLDLDANGKLKEPNDAWGFGAYPGQYGMAVFSRFPIQQEAIRTFQKFRWSQMPQALRPMLPDGEPSKQKSYYSDEVWNQLRLSSKSHWDVPIQIGDQTIHLIASHPTPPVFDGPEDRNGCRNHDEIRMIMDYIAADDTGDYLVDDQGNRGSMQPNTSFVVVGDLNADPVDGDGRAQAIRKLLEHPRVAKYPAPQSSGGVEAAAASAGANLKHQGNPANDTGDFNDKNPGNLRIDFVLPSANLKVLASGVYWPSKSQSPESAQLVNASDHRLVWVDIQITP